MGQSIDEFNDELRLRARSDNGYWNSVANEMLKDMKRRDAEFKKWLRESRMKAK